MSIFFRVLTAALLIMSFAACSNNDDSSSVISVVSTESITESVPVIDDTTMHNGKTLAEYYAENDDTIGWINIDGTDIDYLVMLSSKTKSYEGDTGNPDAHYLHHNKNHEYDFAGEIFMDFRCVVTPEKTSQNMTLYGHHMADGTMFARLERFRQKSFFEEHRYINFDTLWHKNKWEVFAVFTVDLNTEEGLSFDYRQPEYKTQTEFIKFIDEVKKKSFYDTGVKVLENDSILTLSTCTFPTGNVNVDNARLVVMARLCK